MSRRKRTLNERVTILETNYKILLDTFTECNKDLSKEVKEIHTKINKILNIQVNGKQGLEESLKDLYELTKSQRANRRLKKAFDDWINSKPTIKKFYSSKIFKYFSFITILWFIFGILKLLNINVTFEDFVKFISNIIS